MIKGKDFFIYLYNENEDIYERYFKITNKEFINLSMNVEVFSNDAVDLTLSATETVLELMNMNKPMMFCINDNDVCLYSFFIIGYERLRNRQQNSITFKCTDISYFEQARVLNRSLLLDEIPVNILPNPPSDFIPPPPTLPPSFGNIEFVVNNPPESDTGTGMPELESNYNRYLEFKTASDHLQTMYTCFSRPAIINPNVQTPYAPYRKFKGFGKVIDNFENSKFQTIEVPLDYLFQGLEAIKQTFNLPFSSKTVLENGKIFVYKNKYDDTRIAQYKQKLRIEEILETNISAVNYVHDNIYDRETNLFIRPEFSIYVQDKDFTTVEEYNTDVTEVTNTSIRLTEYNNNIRNYSATATILDDPLTFPQLGDVIEIENILYALTSLTLNVSKTSLSHILKLTEQKQEA